MAPLGLRKTISNSLNINETDIAQTKACEPKIWVERVRQKSGADHERDFRFSFERHQPFTSDARVGAEGRGSVAISAFPQLHILTCSARKSLIRLRSRGDDAPKSVACPERMRQRALPRQTNVVPSMLDRGTEQGESLTSSMVSVSHRW
jgi:hypothetical protein